MNNEGGYYYDLFKFFSDQHGLILVDTEIQDIIRVVEKFKDDKHYEEHMIADAALDDDEDLYFGDEDEDDDRMDECQICGLVGDDHRPGCPEDDSPFGLLHRRGFD